MTCGEILPGGGIRDITTSWDDQIVPESFNSVGPIYNLGPQEYRPCEYSIRKLKAIFPCAAVRSLKAGF